jgi:galactofuranosylgalactofuranosylrhamnosyl-N-acetylglucosaminyl-diphospho-decaprenol beta-1,5/1,6-galactofuranosyltransferase
MDATWYRLASYDSAVVSMKDGTSAASTAATRALRPAAKDARDPRTLPHEWPRLAAEYRAALGDITSPEAWDETLRPWTEPADE